jgi:hypothetical protein
MVNPCAGMACTAGETVSAWCAANPSTTVHGCAAATNYTTPSSTLGCGNSSTACVSAQYCHLGVCVTYATVGQTCAHSGTMQGLRCAPDLTCSHNASGGVMGGAGVCTSNATTATTQPAVTTQQAYCGNGLACPSTQYCLGEGGSAACTAFATSGSACNESSIAPAYRHVCTPGLVCNPPSPNGPLGHPGTCGTLSDTTTPITTTAAAGTNGSVCNIPNSPCADGLTCTGVNGMHGTCVPTTTTPVSTTTPLAASCANGGEPCHNNTYCRQGACVAYATVGQTCNESGTLVRNTCAPGLVCQLGSGGGIGSHGTCAEATTVTTQPSVDTTTPLAASCANGGEPCHDNTYCRQGSCVAYAMVGQTCNESGTLVRNTCAPGLVCQLGSGGAIGSHGTCVEVTVTTQPAVNTTTQPAVNTTTQPAGDTTTQSAGDTTTPTQPADRTTPTQPAGDTTTGVTTTQSVVSANPLGASSSSGKGSAVAPAVIAALVVVALVVAAVVVRRRTGSKETTRSNFNNPAYGSSPTSTYESDNTDVLMTTDSAEVDEGGYTFTDSTA